MRRALAAGIAAAALTLYSLTAVLPAQAIGNGPSGPLYPSTPLLTDNFSSGELSPFIPNNGLTPGGS
jgi:hypothetical protein